MRIATPHTNRIALNGDEFDALTRWRRYLTFRAGERKWVKRTYQKRLRLRVRAALRRTPCAEFV